MFKMFFMITSSTLLLMSLLLQGCAQPSVKQQKPDNVTSFPSGATVYANDKKLGVTPLKYQLFEAFPAGWKNSSYQAEGRLVVKKDGCEDSTLDVSDYILSKPIHVVLDCSKKKAEALAAATLLSKIEKRLEKVEVLYQKKLISKDEYTATRERILSEL